MRITFVINDLHCGGAQRVMSIMANFWAAKLWDVTVVTLDSSGSFYELDQRISLLPLNLCSDSTSLYLKFRNNLRRMRALRETIHASRPDIVISFIHTMNVLTVLATRGLSFPVIVSERTDPATCDVGEGWKYLQNLTYRWADKVVVQTKGALNYFPSKIQRRAVIIPNPILAPPQLRGTSTISKRQKTVVAVGRLNPVKRFDVLMKAFASVAERQKDWNLLILGEGPARGQLESLRSDLRLESRILLPGNHRKVHEVLSNAELFVMSSRCEGFPNALCEAMACGLPVISTDCPSGPREIVRHEIDGLLVANENLAALTAAMDRLMGSETERNRLAREAGNVRIRFSLEGTMKAWEGLICEMLKTQQKQEVSKGQRFEFGKNWKRFLRTVDETRLNQAEISLKDLLQSNDLKGKRFLDVGCGSGLFSLAARRLGASVHSFDYDPKSAACTRHLKRRFYPDDPHWTIDVGSALDKDYLKKLEQFDIVYSFGVLHHTGAMWEAMENTSSLVRERGKLFVAIYNDQGGWSKRWLRLKQIYNRLPPYLKLPYAILTMGTREARSLLAHAARVRIRDYVRSWTEYEQGRGMSRWHDWIDWIGGYPFEFAKPEEVFAFFKTKGYELERLKTAGGSIACNQFLFTKGGKPGQ